MSYHSNAAVSDHNHKDISANFPVAHSPERKKEGGSTIMWGGVVGGIGAKRMV